MATSTAPRKGKRRQATAEQIAASKAKAEHARELGQQLLTNPEQVANLVKALLDHAVSARIASYSFKNQAQLFAQAEEAGIVLTDVAGYREWQERGRQVRRAPVSFRLVSYKGDGTTKEEREAEETNGENTERSRRFGTAVVFDISQTDPIEGAEQAEMERVVNPAETLYRSLVEQFERREITVTREAEAVDAEDTVNVHPELNPVDASLFLAHELAALLTAKDEPPAVAEADKELPPQPAETKGARAVNDPVLAILARAEVDGCHLRLVGQLDRKDYVAVNEVLENLGGKWSRKDKAHVFPSDPSDALARVLESGQAPRPARTIEGYVPTPAELADGVVYDYAGVQRLPAGARVLEPSAGDGALVRAVLAANPDVVVTAVEPNAERASLIGDDPRVTLVVDTMEAFSASTTERFDVVVMNPPFAMPGQPTVWIDHVKLAWELLAPGGRLVSIVPSGFTFRQDRRHAEVRELVDAHGGYEPLDPEAFKASGTSVNTVVVWAERAAAFVAA